MMVSKVGNSGISGGEAYSERMTELLESIQ